MPRQKRNAEQPSFLENYGKTAPAVPAIRNAVNEWREGGYKGATRTSRELLNYWFRTDHHLPNGLMVKHPYEAKGEYTVVVKVIDILGNDTTKAVQVKVG
ncbi:MAG: hypothetical protein IPK19_31415 [Chloroflexi bacterium]|nr:hypothetical protein [Chloroflexota bacterium]